MNLVKSLSNFWTVTLGVDCPEEVDIEDSNSPEMKELRESLERVKKIENSLKSTSPKGGKGGRSGKSAVQEEYEVVVDNRLAVATAAKKAADKKEKAQTQGKHAPEGSERADD